MQELDQFGFGHRSTLPTLVEILVSLNEVAKRVGRKSMSLHRPLSKAAQRLQVDVSRPGSHAFIELSQQPTLDRASLDVPQQMDAAIVKQDTADALRVFEVPH